jgi:hypothetical protein
LCSLLTSPNHWILAFKEVFFIQRQTMAWWKWCFEVGNEKVHTFENINVGFFSLSCVMYGCGKKSKQFGKQMHNYHICIFSIKSVLSFRKKYIQHCLKCHFSSCQDLIHGKWKAHICKLYFHFVMYRLLIHNFVLGYQITFFQFCSLGLVVL